MDTNDRGDAVRQVATVAGAALQLAGAVVVGRAAGDATGGPAAALRTPIFPATYAFAIWAPIFGLSSTYTVYQALPANRANPLLRRVGWPAAGAFALNGLWEVAFAGRPSLAAQLTIAGAWACSATGLLILFDETRRRRPSRAERRLVAPTLGLLAGWLTAATLVGLAATLVARGWAAEGTGAALGGGALLLLGGGIATAIVAATKAGPTAGWLAYGAAVLWALAAVIANQVDDSLVTTGAATASAALVLFALLARPPGSPSAATPYPDGNVPKSPLRWRSETNG